MSVKFPRDIIFRHKKRFPKWETLFFRYRWSGSNRHSRRNTILSPTTNHLAYRINNPNVCWNFFNSWVTRLLQIMPLHFNLVKLFHFLLNLACPIFLYFWIKIASCIRASSNRSYSPTNRYSIFSSVIS